MRRLPRVANDSLKGMNSLKLVAPKLPTTSVCTVDTERLKEFQALSLSKTLTAKCNQTVH